MMIALKLLILCTMLVCISGIQIPMHFGPRCMIVQAEFEPIKLQIKFPAIPNAKEGEKYKVLLMDFVTSQVNFEKQVQPNTVFRQNLQLITNKLYHICIYPTDRSFFNEQSQQFYIDYSADQDFDTLIGTIEIPKQLQSEQNLKVIYNMSESVTRISQKIIKHQTREREMEDNLAESNLHKNSRIISLTLIECFVIILSGVYQVFALRRFLIQKNLY